MKGTATIGASSKPLAKKKPQRGLTSMRTRTIAAAMMLIGVTAADGHSWYPHDCCHDNDCKSVPCGELSEMRHGLMWRGVVVFNETQVKPSRDQFCHVCVKEQVDMVPYVPLCVFVPPMS